MKRLNKKGFTITELVIVISVIAILSAVMIPTFSGIIGKSKDSAAVQDAKNAYTEYLAEADHTGETFTDDFIYEYDDDRYVAIKDGEVVKDANGKNVFKTPAEAATAMETTFNAETQELKSFVDDKGTATTDDDVTYENLKVIVAKAGAGA